MSTKNNQLKKPWQSEIALLEALALKAKENQSWGAELKRKYKVALTHKTVFKALKSLLNKKMINEVKDFEKLRADKPNPAQAYEITTYGLLVALYYQSQSEMPLLMKLHTQEKVTSTDKTKDKNETPTLWREIDVIASRHKQKIPLIFGKWDYFKKHESIDLVVNSLRNFFEYNESMPSMLFQQENKDRQEVVDLGIVEPTTDEEQMSLLVSRLVETLSIYVLFPEPTPSLDYASSWFEAYGGWEHTLLSDNEIREFIFSQIAQRKRYHHQELKQLNLWEHHLSRF